MMSSIFTIVLSYLIDISLFFEYSIGRLSASLSPIFLKFLF
jgi:hypothetical protein